MSTLFPELFRNALPPGIEQAKNIVSAEEEADLIRRINGAALEPFRFQQWLGKRLTHSFGWRYDFTDASLSEAGPLPDWLLPLRERAAALAGMAPDALVQALVTRYDPGAGIGWHRDRPVFEHVVGVSLGAPAVLRLRRRRADGRFDRAEIPLEPRGSYHLSGEARHGWEHSIAPMDASRWSVTFRSLAG
ncbi:alkylated DNA repair dioxygenase AlkB [Sphingomonas kyeonggiensis]|uniref:Alkylated DNA repair dioxygenase AlkB n=1 Tax=Sphingomonas kyeonggiensis TaxID=1268553 RepID=A0A7W7K3T8_9SPHN|nr:alpha-ketoglutarate-dependent dioxygenase AlkB [Sphingomonas kyeonggiensis]MBB4840192.1 alkylated DNA repair dioxygenase AlkB [Sphingomonas kyeonggiensis]